MTDEGEVQAHTATYRGFLGLLKWGMLGVAAVVALVVTLIAR